ncbi:hypothetical protein [Streptomyces sp. NPDC048496]|uniref:hypothetical protein n=1 Tax=Streptomyces sp. NPDC048496 TaxID=3365558 RepID=UPI00371802C0
MFTIGTRLTREMTHRDVDTHRPPLRRPSTTGAAASGSAGGRVPSSAQGGGTPPHVEPWSSCSPTAGSAVSVLLADRMRRLHRPAHRVVPSNPRPAGAGYEPRAAGMAAVLPRVDAFVEGYSLQALEQLAVAVGGAAPAGGECDA